MSKTVATYRKMGKLGLEVLKQVLKSEGQVITGRDYAILLQIGLYGGMSSIVPAEALYVMESVISGFRRVDDRDKEAAATRMTIVVTDRERLDMVAAGLTLLAAPSKHFTSDASRIVMGMRLLRDGLLVDGELDVPIRLEAVDEHA